MRLTTATPRRSSQRDRQWLMVEADSLPCPPGVDPKDPELAGGAVRMVLPPAVPLGPVRGAAVQRRRHQARPAGAPLVLARPPGQRRRGEALAQGRARRLLDLPARRDPLHRRAGLRRRRRSVHRWQAGHLARLCRGGGAGPARSGAAEACVRPMVGNGHRHGGAEAYANACLRRLALAPEGRRHNTCLAVCLPPARPVQGRPARPRARRRADQGRHAGKGFPIAEIDAILEWAWQTVEPEGLRHG